MPTAHILEHDQPYASAPGGLVVIDSNHPDYFLAVADTELHPKMLRGEHYVEDQAGSPTKVLTLMMPGTGTDAHRSNPTITIGKEFFVTALKDYNDWKEKWWREAIQNAVDAGANHIICSAKDTTLPSGEACYEVSCEDDGGGMDESTLLNKFLVLGGSTKVSTSTTGTSTAGGFGKAKELLILPWLAWAVHSRGTITEGSGADYTVRPASHIGGTKVTVWMPLDNHTTAAHATNFICKCYLPDVAFTVVSEDGEKAHPKAALKTTDNSLVEVLENAVEVHHVSSGKKYESKTWNMYVRTKTKRGSLFMFNVFCDDVPGYIVADIIVPSISVLTANRDGFRDQSLNQALSNFGRRLAKDVLSTLRRKQGMIREVFKGTGRFKAREREQRLLEAMAQMPAPATAKKELTDEDAAAAVDALLKGEAAVERERAPERDTNTIGSPTDAPEAAKDMLTNTELNGPDHIRAAMKQLSWEPDFFLINEIEGKVPKKFFPEHMTPAVRRLAKIWVAMCRYVLMQLGSTQEYGVGYIFSDTTMAAFLRDNDTNWLLLNPSQKMGEFGKIWRPSDPKQLKTLYALAVHEATHLADGISYHDEAFASALTKNMAHCANGFRHIKKIVAGIKMRGGAEVDVESED